MTHLWNHRAVAITNEGLDTGGMKAVAITNEGLDTGADRKSVV